MEFMVRLEAQLKQFEPDTAQHLLAGMLYEVYFNSRGDFRDKAKFSYADKLLSVVTQEEFSDALNFIQYHLRSHTDRLVFMPGDQTRKLIQIILRPLPPPKAEAHPFFKNLPDHQVNSVLLDGVELMRRSAEVEMDDWSRMAQRASVSPERIRDRVSDELAIPKWALTIETVPPISADINLAMPEGFELNPELAVERADKP